MPRIGKAGRIVLIAVFILVGIVIVLFVALVALSPGRPRPFLDEQGAILEGSISEKTRVSVNGARLGMFIKGKDAARPVLLFLHGGTAMPEYFLDQRYHSGLEQSFTVCWWDRRGAGLSYTPDTPPETMSLEQSIADTIAVTDYLRGRFHKDKIYLMAHSGGSLIGIQAAARAPQLYHAYIGVGQMAYQLRSEIAAYEYMLGRYREMGNAGMARRLEAGAPAMSVPLPASYNAIRDKAMHDLGVGTTRDMRSVITGVLLPSWFCRDYTIREKYDLWRGKFAGDKLLWNTMLATDLTSRVTELGLPLYFFHGKYDYTVAYPVTKAYFEKLRAPVKGFYTFERSAHSPMFEEPARMRRIVEQDVFAAKNSLADVR